MGARHHLEVSLEHRAHLRAVDPKRLLEFGSVNAGKPDFVLLAVGIEHGNGVAIMGANNAVRQGSCLCRSQNERKKRRGEVRKLLGI